MGVWEGEKLGGGEAPRSSDLNILEPLAHLVSFQPNSRVLATAGDICGEPREWCQGVRQPLGAGMVAPESCSRSLGNNPNPQLQA